MSKYVATRMVHHDGREYKTGQLVPFDDGNKQHDTDIADLVRMGAIKPCEELEALKSLTVDKLKQLAEAEEIALPEGATTKDAIAAIIIAHRAHLADEAKDHVED